MGGLVNTTLLLAEMNACGRAMDWARYKAPAEAWDSCSRGDWLAFFLAGIGYDRRALVRVLMDLVSRLGYGHEYMTALGRWTQPRESHEPVTVDRFRFLMREADTPPANRSYGQRLNAPLTAHAIVHEHAFDHCGRVHHSTADDMLALSLKVSADIIHELVPWSEVEPLIKQWVKDRERARHG